MKKILILLCSLLLLFALTSCSSIKEVENEPLVLLINDSEIEGYYTGTLEKNIPIEDGIFTFENGAVFTGSFTDGLPADGVLSDLPLEIEIDGTVYSGKYSGSSNGLTPHGNGELISDETGFHYTGAFTGGNADGSGTVENLPITMNLYDTDYIGAFNGTVSNFIPTGEGSFSYEDGDAYITYDGAFDGFAFSGDGILDTTEHIVFFTDGLNRKGTYTGKVVDGVPSGDGEFLATNSFGDVYRMSGNWENGLLNGQGKREWLELNSEESQRWVDEVGNFTNGDFDPGLLDFVFYVSQYEPKFTLADATQEFIKGHEDMFLTHTAENLEELIDPSFDYNLFAKDSRNFNEKLFTESNLEVVQTYIFTEFTQFNVVFYLAYDRDTYSNAYYIYMINDSSDVVTDDIIELCALPMAYSTFENTAGGKTWTTVCLGVNMTK